MHARSTAGRSGGPNTYVLWSAQALLALVFAVAGSMKLLTPIDLLLAQMPLPLPGAFVQFIGCCEVLGALGLVLPGLVRVQPGLTPLAAAGLTIIMTGATVLTLISGMGPAALVPLVLGALTGFVAYGRWQPAPRLGAAVRT
jgi:uncharacterized membrane protein YphA (DoxX/SURF4 family)